MKIIKKLLGIVIQAFTPKPVTHVCDMREVALTDECDFGCKVLGCVDLECKKRVVSHRRIYGCSMG